MNEISAVLPLRYYVGRCVHYATGTLYRMSFADAKAGAHTKDGMTRALAEMQGALCGH